MTIGRHRAALQGDSMPLPQFDPTQQAHAKAMIREVQRRGLPRTAAVIVIATAIVESGIRVYANRNVPGSMDIPHEAVGQDHASVGPLQQQVPSWGTARDCMDPVKATGKFLDGAGNNPGLLNLPPYRFQFVGHPTATRWDQIPPGAAAQAVQVSAYPDRYQQQAALAAELVNTYWLPPEDDMTPEQDARLARVEAAVAATQATAAQIQAYFVDEGYHRSLAAILMRRLRGVRYAHTRTLP